MYTKPLYLAQIKLKNNIWGMKQNEHQRPEYKSESEKHWGN